MRNDASLLASLVLPNECSGFPVFRPTSCTSEINAMIRLLSGDLWKHLRRLGSQSTQRMAAVAYFTDISEIPFRRGDTLVVDASDGAIRCGETSKNALDILA